MARDVDQPHFVWMRGLRGPERQKWATYSFGPDSAYMRNRVIAAHPISQEDFDNLSLDDLEKRFPCPVSA